MKYLCSRHRAALAAQPWEALSCWEGAMRNGQQAIKENRHNYARAFFGCAWELAVMHVHPGCKVNAYFAVNHLVDAGDKLCRVLVAIDCLHETECLLRLMRDYVLLGAGDSALDAPRREQLLKLYNVVEELTQLCSPVRATQH
ncbi:hypothetical protein WKI13_18040 [Teredinibacter turnerae]|uniref:hypothetical protein n=1 Tax=Teredinibacter turnerae TaxID=2426 RepID=UPI0004761681|nr:hypothetical protein [Teredinibacter turnerae]